MQRGSESGIYGFGIKQNQRELRWYKHEHFHNENRNRDYRGLEISKGYGTQYCAWASARKHLQVERAGFVRTFGRRCVEDSARVDLEEDRLVAMLGPVLEMEI